VVEVKGRKVTVDLSLLAGQTLCATGRIVAVEIPAK
jgi:FKBP-type peptidyl-prolyl cis-trans isomerase 2